MKKLHFESYEVEYSYKNEEGYLRKDKKVIRVPLIGKLQSNEKRNHSFAERLFLQENPGCQVEKVTYG